MVEKIYKKVKNKLHIHSFRKNKNNFLIFEYIKNGQIPWTKGYNEYKWQEITKILNNSEALLQFNKQNCICNIGKSIDERIIEYPWIFTNLHEQKGRLLDAGSTFNYKNILEQPLISNKELTIITFHPEDQNYNEKRISYIYSDLREIPIKDNYFDEIVCQSTLEHIDMDNSMYGYNINHNELITTKSYEYIKVIKELMRVLKPKGRLLITVPFGYFENHGFFQQFDNEMIDLIKNSFRSNGQVEESYFKYLESGWISSTQEECNKCRSFNPHTGIGKGDDNAAHSRAICCIKYIKEYHH